MEARLISLVKGRLGHFVNLPFCPLAILTTCHFFNLPFFQLDILSTSHFVNQPNVFSLQRTGAKMSERIGTRLIALDRGARPFCQLDILSTSPFVNLPFCQLAILSTCQFVNQPNVFFTKDMRYVK